jgi:hypothetical protein
MNSDRLTIIEETQQEILTEIKNLKLEIEKLQTICSRMDAHISFVETTYDKFKYPLNVVKNKIENLFGRTITHTD